MMNLGDAFLKTPSRAKPPKNLLFWRRLIRSPPALSPTNAVSVPETYRRYPVT
jgi:hypothetical protein